MVDIRAAAASAPKARPTTAPNYKDSGLASAWPGRRQGSGGKTTFRGGFGIYYGGNQNDDFSDPAESAVPRRNSLSLRPISRRWAIR